MIEDARCDGLSANAEPSEVINLVSPPPHCFVKYIKFPNNRNMKNEAIVR